MIKNRLLIFAYDANSANVTMSYAYLNKDKFSQILAYPKGNATNIYKQHISKYITSEPIEFLPSDTVVTGTSGIHSTYEMQMIKQAKISNVKNIITIVDNTTNFDIRFILDDKILEKQYLPNQIWVFEKNFKSDISYINKNLIYKDNIYKQFLIKLFKTNPPKIKHKFIQKYQNKYLVILTEYLYELYSLQFNFTEYEMLENILKNISLQNINIPIFLKLHPVEHKNKFNILLRKYNHLNIIQDDCNIQELIFYSKVVFGINSSVFNECNLFKKPAYSIQIGSNKTMKVKTIDKSNIIYTNKELEKILQKEFQ